MSTGGKIAVGIALTIGALFIVVPILSSIEDASERNSPTCKSDYHRCADNGQLLRDYEHAFDVKFFCKREATARASYGEPQWPSRDADTFQYHYSGDSYVKTGQATVIEHDARFQNGFGAMVHSTVTCTYDLNTKKVVDVSITAN
jgi:hypothetical protein